MKFTDLKKYNNKEIHSAGPRYTPGQDKKAPNLHIQALEDALDALSLSKRFLIRIQELRTHLSKAIEKYPKEIRIIFKRRKKNTSTFKRSSF